MTKPLSHHHIANRPVQEVTAEDRALYTFIALCTFFCLDLLRQRLFLHVCPCFVFVVFCITSLFNLIYLLCLAAFFCARHHNLPFVPDSDSCLSFWFWITSIPAEVFINYRVISSGVMFGPCWPLYFVAVQTFKVCKDSKSFYKIFIYYMLHYIALKCWCVTY